MFFSYSTSEEGKMGFSTPYNGKIYSSGLERNIHVHIPIKMDVKINLKKSKVNVTLEPIEKNETEKLFEYSTQAFTSIQDSSKMNLFMARKDALLVHNEPIKVVSITLIFFLISCLYILKYLVHFKYSVYDLGPRNIWKRKIWFLF